MMMMTEHAVPPGYRFVPTDLELLNHYLRRKINKDSLPYNVVRELNVYAYTPDEIADRYKPTDGEKMYFFSPRERKYTKGKKTNRTVAAGDGYWKASASKQIYDGRNVHVGSRKMLEYMKSEHGKSKKSIWIMQEYTIQTNEDKWDDLVLCTIYKTPRSLKKNSNQDTRDSQMNAIRQISSEPCLIESSDARSSKKRRVSSDLSLPCYPSQFLHENIASSSMAAGEQMTSNATYDDHGFSVTTSQDYGVQQFQSSIPAHQEMQTFIASSSMAPGEQMTSNATYDDDGFSVTTSQDYGVQQFQSYIPAHQEMQMFSPQQQQSYPITGTEVGFNVNPSCLDDDRLEGLAKLVCLDDEMLAGLEKLDRLYAYPLNQFIRNMEAGEHM